MARRTESLEPQVTGRKLVQALHVHLRPEERIDHDMISEVRAAGDESDCCCQRKTVEDRRAQARRLWRIEFHK